MTPIFTASMLEMWAPLLTGFSFGEAADHGFNSAFSAALAKKMKGPLAQWMVQVVEKGWHHFILGLWLMLLMSYYIPALWAVLIYWFSLGLVLSETDMVAQLIKELEDDISQASALFAKAPQ